MSQDRVMKRGGKRKRSSERTTVNRNSLELEGLSEDLNCVRKLCDYFNNFGKITSIQIRYDEGKELGIVTFERPDEASKAYEQFCSDQILNNKRIKISLHTEIINEAEEFEICSQKTLGETSTKNLSIINSQQSVDSVDNLQMGELSRQQDEISLSSSITKISASKDDEKKKNKSLVQTKDNSKEVVNESQAEILKSIITELMKLHQILTIRENLTKEKYGVTFSKLAVGEAVERRRKELLKILQEDKEVIEVEENKSEDQTSNSSKIVRVPSCKNHTATQSGGSQSAESLIDENNDSFSLLMGHKDSNNSHKLQNEKISVRNSGEKNENTTDSLEKSENLNQNLINEIGTHINMNLQNEKSSVGSKGEKDEEITDNLVKNVNNNSINDTDTRNSMESNYVENSIKNKKKKTKQHNFQPYYKELKGLKDWLVYEGGDRAYCKVCISKKTQKNVQLLVDLQTFRNHAKSKRHWKTNLKLNEPPPDEDFIRPQEIDLEKKRAIAAATAIFIGSCTTLNVPYANQPKILAAIKSVDCGIFKEVQFERTAARAFIVNGLAKEAEREIVEELRVKKFSFCFDESDTISKEKNLSVIVRYPSEITKKIEVRLYTMIPVFEKDEDADSGAKRICDILINKLKKNEIPLSNAVGCCCDGCKVNTGRIKGVEALLKKLIPGLVCVSCPAHAINLCAQYGRKEIPEYLEELFKKINKMFLSAHRQHDLRKIQRKLRLPIHRMLRMSGTRWLSMQMCAERLLEQLTAVKELAEKVLKKDSKDSNAHELLVDLQKKETKFYLLALIKVCQEMNAFNRLIQSKGVVIHRVQDELEKRFRNVLAIIMKREYVNRTNVSDIDYENEENYLPRFQFDLGEEIRHELLTNGHEYENFCKDVVNFVLRSAIQMAKRFENFKNKTFLTSKCLSPKLAMSADYRNKNSTIFNELIHHYPHLSKDNEKNLTDQWEKLPNLAIPKNLLNYRSRPELFWFYVRDAQDDCGIRPFEDLGNFALFVMTTPHGNADPERSFSAQNNCQTKNRNRMINVTLDATLRAQEYIRAHQKNGIFVPNDRIIDIILAGKFYK